MTTNEYVGYVTERKTTVPNDLWETFTVLYNPAAPRSAGFYWATPKTHYNKTRAAFILHASSFRINVGAFSA